ncbi:hypothetical protein AF335_09420 [Streptomyces eurocidicus]|uniref:Uncharacterized protein n=1 Tax=Streptomyces eurocidicus TaxID=66423 RepID=A0A2N8P130_STREU|nr:hypothetical protein AF335_09420 [Streptomyces eurocidicus]
MAGLCVAGVQGDGAAGVEAVAEAAGVDVGELGTGQDQAVGVLHRPAGALAAEGCGVDAGEGRGSLVDGALAEGEGRRLHPAAARHDEAREGVAQVVAVDVVAGQHRGRTGGCEQARAVREKASRRAGSVPGFPVAARGPEGCGRGAVTTSVGRLMWTGRLWRRSSPGTRSISLAALPVPSVVCATVTSAYMREKCR